MQAIKCEMCNSVDVVKDGDYFVCQSCGTKYTVEQAKKMMIEGTVKIDNTEFVQKYLANARRAKQKEDWKEAEKYYNMVEQNDPTNIEAIFYSSFSQVKLALLEKDTREKRQNIFNILVKSVSVIDDNYGNTNEEREKLLSDIMDDIQALEKGTIVPTTHLQDYVTKNGYGNIVDRTQIIEDDSLSVTYDMIHGVFDAYMESLLNIIKEHSTKAAEKLFLENMGGLYTNSDLFEKAAEYIEGFKSLQQAAEEIAGKMEISNYTTIQEIHAKINELAKTVCPMYMTEGEAWGGLVTKTKNELRKKYPNCKALKTGGCYVATCVYGSYDCPQVWTLRRYRDNTLAKTWYGRAFIKTYYAISPTLVKWFGNTAWFKKMWQPKLDRMVKRLNNDGVESTPYQDRNW